MRKEILNLLALDIRSVFADIDDTYISEIRLRTDKPAIIAFDNEEFFIGKGKEGLIKEEYDNAFVIKEAHIKETFEYITNYSLYAYNDELKKGYITVNGGHRIGICGKTVYEGNEIKTIRNIQSLNIRLAHEVVGCGSDIAGTLFKDNAFCNTLIISGPGEGKTTLLRDLIRILSSGDYDRNICSKKGFNIGVADERSEICASFFGKPQNNVGIRTDVLDCCQKSDGLLMLVRAMKPDILAADEIGSDEDCMAIKYCSLCGCKVLLTMHGTGLGDVLNKDCVRKLVDGHVFERFIICGHRNNKRIKLVYNEKMEKMGEFIC